MVVWCVPFFFSSFLIMNESIMDLELMPFFHMCRFENNLAGQYKCEIGLVLHIGKENFGGAIAIRS